MGSVSSTTVETASAGAASATSAPASVLGAVAYEIGHTSVTTTAEEALVAGHGVCQDHAQVLIAAARHLGFPARYVSGYLCPMEEGFPAASHAWAELFVDGLGWVGFDPANRVSPDEHYVRVACGRDYHDAAPIRGLRRGGLCAAPSSIRFCTSFNC